MPCGISGSLWDLSGNKIQFTFGRLVQAIPGGTDVNQDKTETPVLHDGYGNPIRGVKFQEAFERDANGDIRPTIGPFYDTFWEEDENGDKQPKDIKFGVDTNGNLELLNN